MRLLKIVVMDRVPDLEAHLQTLWPLYFKTAILIPAISIYSLDLHYDHVNFLITFAGCSFSWIVDIPSYFSSSLCVEVLIENSNLGSSTQIRSTRTLLWTGEGSTTTTADTNISQTVLTESGKKPQWSPGHAWKQCNTVMSQLARPVPMCTYYEHNLWFLHAYSSTDHEYVNLYTLLTHDM